MIPEKPPVLIAVHKQKMGLVVGGGKCGMTAGEGVYSFFALLIILDTHRPVGERERGNA